MGLYYHLNHSNEFNEPASMTMTKSPQLISADIAADIAAESATEPAASVQNVRPYIENISEATAACLFTMVQGNVLLLGLSHWIVASQTGIVAGILATLALWFAKTTKPWVISLVLGSITAIVDYFVHPGMFDGVVTEAIVTGIAAGLISFVIGYTIAYLRRSESGKS